ncbi:hypothetical protein JXI42_06880 [bacterium]|nr:hypothetical protein [bacterium]
MAIKSSKIIVLVIFLTVNIVIPNGQNELNTILNCYNMLKTGWLSEFEEFGLINTILESYNTCKYADLPRSSFSIIDSCYRNAIPIIEKKLDQISIRYYNEKSHIRYGMVGVNYIFIGAKQKGLKILKEYISAKEGFCEKDFNELMMEVSFKSNIGIYEVYRVFESYIGERALYILVYRFGTLGSNPQVDSLVEFWSEENHLKNVYEKMDNYNRKQLLGSLRENCDKRAIPIIDKLLEIEHDPATISNIMEIKTELKQKPVLKVRYFYDDTLVSDENFKKRSNAEAILDIIEKSDDLEFVLNEYSIIQNYAQMNIRRPKDKMSNCGRSIDSIADIYREPMISKINSLITDSTEIKLKLGSGTVMVMYNDFTGGEKIIRECINDDRYRKESVPGWILFYMWPFDLESIKHLVPIFKEYLYMIDNIKLFLKRSSFTATDSSGRFMSEYIYNNAILDSVYSIDYSSNNLFMNQMPDFKTGIVFKDQNGPMRLEILQAMRGKYPVPNPNYLKHWVYLTSVETDPALRDIIYEYIGEIPQIHPGLWGPFRQTLKEDIPIAIDLLNDEGFIYENEKIKRNILIERLLSMYNQL